MRVLHVVDELSPVTGDSGRARTNRFLCGAQAVNGVDVNVTVRLRAELDPKAELARQLHPLQLDAETLQVYRGRLPDGRVNVTALASEACTLSVRHVLDASLTDAHTRDQWPDILHLDDSVDSVGCEAIVEELARSLQRPQPTLFVGRDIPPGIDAARWNPSTDAYIPARFDHQNLAGKRECKLHTQRAGGLALRSRVPLVVALAPIESDLLSDLIQSARDIGSFQLLVVLDGDRDEDLRAQATTLVGAYADRVQICTERGAHLRRLCHLAVAGSDYVFAGRRNPHGPGELYPLHYGSLLIAPATPAFAELVDFDLASRSGAGFLFDRGGGPTLTRAVRRAIAAHGPSLEPLRSRLMRLDLSWATAARRYLDRYNHARNAQNLAHT